jgi:peptide/nickel transport system ATP-binding protein
LKAVGIPRPERRLDDYPHQFSGGMRQRVMIAMSLINNPDLLIADEPTTALDVTTQAQILNLMMKLQADFGSAIIMITHDLGVIAEIADEVLVMYGGRAVEYGVTREVLTRPEMPYTWGLLSSVPDVGGASDVLVPIPGTPPSLLNPPTGCSFHPRCTFVQQVPDNLCVTTLPVLERSAAGSPEHLSRCHLRDPASIYDVEIAPIVAPNRTESPA